MNIQERIKSQFDTIVKLKYEIEKEDLETGNSQRQDELWESAAMLYFDFLQVHSKLLIKYPHLKSYLCKLKRILKSGEWMERAKMYSDCIKMLHES